MSTQINRVLAIIGKLFRAGNAEITRLEFGGHVGEDAGFQVLANKPTLAFAPHHYRAEPLLAGKGEIDRGFQILLGVLLMGDDEVHRKGECLIRGSGLELEDFDDPEERLAVRGVIPPDEWLIAVAVVGRDLFTLL